MQSRKVEQFILVLEMEEINEGTYVYTYLHGMVYTHLLCLCVLVSLDLKRRKKKSSLKKLLASEKLAIG